MILLARGAVWVLFAWMWYVFARTDILTEKILNRHVLRSLALAAAAYAALAAWSWRAQGEYLVWGYYGAALEHAAFSAAVALALWLLSVWPAGDAKLFALLALLLPLLQPLGPLASWRLILAVLLNIFVPASFFVVAQSFHWLWKTRAHRVAGFVRQIGVRSWLSSRWENAVAGLDLARLRERAAALGGPRAAAGWLLEQAAVFVSMGVLLAALSARFGQAWWMGLILCAFSYFGWRHLRAALGAGFSVAAAAGAVACAARLGLPWSVVAATSVRLAAYGICMGAGMQLLFATLKGDGSGAVLLAALPLLLGLAGPLLSLSGAILGWALLLGLGLAAVSINTREDPNDRVVNDIRPRMILAPQSLELVRKDADFYAEHFATRYPDGMTEAQADALRRWCVERSIDRLAMQKTLSFAFWIFLGYFLTVALKRNILEIMLHGFKS